MAVALAGGLWAVDRQAVGEELPVPVPRDVRAPVAPPATLGSAAPRPVVPSPITEADGGPTLRALVVLDHHDRRLAHLPVELVEAQDEDDALFGCDDPLHLTELLDRVKRRAPARVAFRGPTDANGELLIPHEVALPKAMVVRTADGLRVSERRVSVPGEARLGLFRDPGPWSVKVITRADRAPVPEARLSVFDPVTGQLTEFEADMSHVMMVPRCPTCVAVVQAPGFFPASVELRGAKTVIPLERPGRVEVRAAWAPDGMPVSLHLMDVREAVMQGGVARFEQVPPGGGTIEAKTLALEHSERLRIEAGQTVTVTIPQWKGASLSVSAATAGGQPLSEGTLSVEPRGPGFSGVSFTALADSPGQRFELEHLPEGPALVTLESPGFRTAEREVVLAPGANELHLELELIEPTVGVIVDADGRPVSGATVSVLGKELVSDERGRFRVELEEDATGDVRAAGFEAREVMLRAGESVRVRLARVVPVRLFIVDSAGQSIDDESVSLMPRDEDASRVRCDVVDGACDVELRPGVEYDLGSLGFRVAPASLRAQATGAPQLVQLSPDLGGAEAVERQRTVIRFSAKQGEPDEGR
jgi:hypothetical protein